MTLHVLEVEEAEMLAAVAESMLTRHGFGVGVEEELATAHALPMGHV